MLSNLGEVTETDKKNKLRWGRLNVQKVIQILLDGIGEAYAPLLFILLQSQTPTHRYLSIVDAQAEPDPTIHDMLFSLLIMW